MSNHCNICLGTHLLYPMYVAIYDDGEHDLIDHIDGHSPECVDCNRACVALDSKEDAERISAIRARRGAMGSYLIPVEVEYLKCYAAVVMGKLVAICTRSQLGQGGTVNFVGARSNFRVALPPELRDGHPLPEDAQ